MVGTPGNTAEPFNAETPSARKRPDLTYGTDDSSESNTIYTLPAIMSGMAWPLPLYGTWINSIGDIVLNKIVARCVELPLPHDA